MAHEGDKQIKFFDGEAEFVAAECRGACCDVDVEFAAIEIRFGLSARSCVHACEEFSEPERFCDVVIGACFEACDDVDFVSSGGEHKDR